jgi:hypothetical protein
MINLNPHSTVNLDLYHRMQHMPYSIPLARRVRGCPTDYNQLIFAGSTCGTRHPSGHPTSGLIDTCRQLLEWGVA